MGYYPPLTDYLADWRMDKIKGEDLQDPTARLQISALSTSVNSLSQQVTTLSVSVANKVNKSGDTMQGNLSMGASDSYTSNSIVLPEGSVNSNKNWTIQNDSGKLFFLPSGYGSRSYQSILNADHTFASPENLMNAGAFTDTWRGGVFVNGELALKFQMEKLSYREEYFVSGPDYNQNPITKLYFDSDNDNWVLETQLGNFTEAGSDSDTALRFRATVDVTYDVWLFKNKSNAIVLPTDIPLIVNATIDTQTGEIDFSELWKPIEWMVKMGRIIHLRAIINSETFEIPLTNCTQTQLRFSGVVYSTTMGVTYAPYQITYAPYQITVVWSEDGTADDFIYFPLADRYELNTLSKGYPVVIPTKSITSGTDAVTATNRAVTSLSYVAADSVTAVNLTFPSINSGFSRDFILYIDFAPNNLVVNLPVSGVTFIVPEGENLSDMTSIDSGAAANIYFSEVKANTFAVHRVTFEAAV